LQLVDRRTRLALSLVSRFITSFVVDVLNGSFVEESTFVVIKIGKIAVFSEKPGVWIASGEAVAWAMFSLSIIAAYNML
jgi:hypothetical protein